MRLTKEIRGRIVEAVMTHRFKEDDATFDKLENQLADELFNQQFTESELKLITNLPKTWVIQSNCIETRMYGSTVRLRYSGYRNSPAQWHYIAFDAVGDLHDRISKFSAQLRKHKDAKFAARSAISGALNKVQTTQTLTRTWPEIAQFIPKDVTVVDKSASLAFPIETLNQMLKLS